MLKESYSHPKRVQQKGFINHKKLVVKNMRWLFSLLGRNNNLGRWQRFMPNMNLRNNRKTTLSLLALAVGATAYGVTRRFNRNFR